MSKKPSGRRRLFVAAASVGFFAISCAACTTYWVMGRVLPAWISSDTRIRGFSHARSEELPAPPIARRLVVVMVDGLGVEHARALSELEPVRQHGAFRELIAEYPTFTLPNVTAMVTGLPPRESGVRLNGLGEGALGADDVLHAAWDTGVYVRVRSRTFPDFLRAARPPLQADTRGGRLAFVADLAVDRARPAITENELAASELDFVHFGEVDDAGHEHGSASAEYAEMAARAGYFVQNVASRLDPARDVMFVLSDHGHRRARGHGGDEPETRGAFFLAWGHRVEGGRALPPRRMIDVAATLSVTMGVPSPSSNLGAPMLDVFDLSETERARAILEPFDQAARFGCALEQTPSCDRVAASLAALRAGLGGDEAALLVTSLARERDDIADQREAKQRLLRLSIGVLVSAVALALARHRRRCWPRARFGWAAPLALFVGYAAVLLVIGYRPTLSAMAGTEIFFGDATRAALGGVALTTLLALRLRWGASEAGFLVLASAAAFLPLALYVGSDPRAIAPNVPSALVFMLSPIVAAAAVAALTIATAAVVRHRRPRSKA